MGMVEVVRRMQTSDILCLPPVVRMPIQYRLVLIQLLLLLRLIPRLLPRPHIVYPIPKPKPKSIIVFINVFQSYFNKKKIYTHFAQLNSYHTSTLLFISFNLYCYCLLFVIVICLLILLFT